MKLAAMTFPKCLAIGAAIFTLGAAAPAWAADQNPGAPVKLTDVELDEVTAGEPILGVDVNATVAVMVQDINVDVEVFVPVDVGVVAQLNVLGTSMMSGVNNFFPDTMSP
jgi:hypothetical protein